MKNTIKSIEFNKIVHNKYTEDLPDTLKLQINKGIREVRFYLRNNYLDNYAAITNRGDILTYEFTEAYGIKVQFYMAARQMNRMNIEVKEIALPTTFIKYKVNNTHETISLQNQLDIAKLNGVHTTVEDVKAYKAQEFTNLDNYALIRKGFHQTDILIVLEFKNYGLKDQEKQCHLY